MSGKNGKPKKPDARKISRKLKPRQRKLIAHYTDPTNEDTFGNGTKAAIAAGYSERSAGQIAHETLKKPEIQREIERALDEVGVTRNKVAQVLYNGLEAKITRVFCQDGVLIYSDPQEDHPTQVRAAEVAGKLRGDFPAHRTIERMELLRIQNTLIVVPGGLPEPEEKAKKVRQLTD